MEGVAVVGLNHQDSTDFRNVSKKRRDLVGDWYIGVSTLIDKYHSNELPLSNSIRFG